MYIEPTHELLEYGGRIDFADPLAPVFVFPCSYIKIRFTGGRIRAVVKNRRNYWNTYLGMFLDGVQRTLPLADTQEPQTLVLGESLSEGPHELMLFKRQDACHIFRFFGFELEDGARVLPLPEKPGRRLEVYGDSVSAGEVSEAVAFAGREDPAWHQGELSNSYYSYAWMTARRLGAQLHDIAQGGIALLDGTGWFSAPEYLGMESVYDKVQYNPAFGAATRWDFSLYRPHVVIVALGQNDSHPEDYMKEAWEGEKAKLWRERYRGFISRLREIYPDAAIILTTTILKHDESWDRAIEEVCQSLQDSRVHHFYYTNNGTGTPGHVRIPEAERMTRELGDYIESLGGDIWEEEKP